MFTPSVGFHGSPNAVPRGQPPLGPKGGVLRIISNMDMNVRFLILCIQSA